METLRSGRASLQQSPMASACNRKRPRADELSQEHSRTKRIRPAPEDCATVFPPAFWDGLSKVSLTSLALRELDRRNKVLQHRPATPGTSSSFLPKDVVRFARQGGPDLRHLRGFLEPKQGPVAMNPTPLASSRSRRTQSTRATTLCTRSGKSSAYGKDFQQHLIDHMVYPVGYDHADGLPDLEPRNLGLIHDALSAERASLSPSRFSQSAFRDFRRKNDQATFESDIVATVLPALCGSSNIPNKQNVLFTELEPITNKTAVKPKPDFFDGARLQQLNPDLRKDQHLRSAVIPTKHPNVPVAPNFFLETKGPSGGADVARRQACHVGAYGARALHALQSYGETEPSYDGNAYSYSSTYHDGVLKLYAHHVTAPSDVEGGPEYHMTHIDTWGMTGNIDAFRRGAAAFRNARDMAKRHRDDFIHAANAKAAQAATINLADITRAQEDTAACRQIQESTGCLGCVASQDADNASQQQIGDSSDCIPRGEAETSAIPRYLCAEDNPQDRSQESALLACDDLSPSLASSFTSFDTGHLRSKRSRQSRSPPAHSKRAQPSTSGIGAGTGSRIVQTPAPTGPVQASHNVCRSDQSRKSSYQQEQDHRSNSEAPN
ncbi:hypothetical protein CDD83_4964 [Cordyceps sp. RAO-2017]|nr:hypothetical protein CDD83_4964 [Cordyceps sp. RAO-2017]